MARVGGSGAGEGCLRTELFFRAGSKRSSRPKARGHGWRLGRAHLKDQHQVRQQDGAGHIVKALAAAAAWAGREEIGSVVQEHWAEQARQDEHSELLPGLRATAAEAEAA